MSSGKGPTQNQERERVPQLRQQYLRGTYKVDAKQLSAKIVDHHLKRREFAHHNSLRPN